MTEIRPRQSQGRRYIRTPDNAVMVEISTHEYVALPMARALGLWRAQPVLEPENPNGSVNGDPALQEECRS